MVKLHHLCEDSKLLPRASVLRVPVTSLLCLIHFKVEVSILYITFSQVLEDPHQELEPSSRHDRVTLVAARPLRDISRCQLCRFNF